MNSKALRCPRFDSCNANICPLDPQWPRAQHRQGERVCGLLSEVVKVGGSARIADVLTAEQVDTFLREWPKVEARWSDIRYRLRAAAKTGSRIVNAKARFRTALQGTDVPPLASVSPDVSAPCADGASERFGIVGSGT